MSAPDDRMWATWLKAHLWIRRGDDDWLHVVPRPGGETAGDFPFHAPVHLLTAFNPWGRELPDDENDMLQARLARHLEAERIETLHSLGASEDRSWMEPGFALLGVDEERAVAVARRFNQRAVYSWTAKELAVVGALDEGRAAVGWRLDHEPPDGLGDQSKFSK